MPHLIISARSTLQVTGAGHVAARLKSWLSASQANVPQGSVTRSNRVASWQLRSSCKVDPGITDLKGKVEHLKVQLD